MQESEYKQKNCKLLPKQKQKRFVTDKFLHLFTEFVQLLLVLGG